MPCTARAAHQNDGLCVGLHFRCLVMSLASRMCRLVPFVHTQTTIGSSLELPWAMLSGVCYHVHT